MKLEQECPPRSRAGRICTVSVPEDPVHNRVALFNRGFQGAFVDCDLLACATIYQANARFCPFMYELACDGSINVFSIICNHE